MTMQREKTERRQKERKIKRNVSNKVFTEIFPFSNKIFYLNKFDIFITSVPN